MPSALQYEIMFVDDSSDDTPAVLQKMSEEWPEIRYIHRTGKRGLASAVVDGFAGTSGKSIVVMDADLQHPPEVIPLMLERLAQSDIVIPSRFISGGSDGGLAVHRKLVSWVARKIASVAIRRLRDVSDNTSGFFALRRSVIKNVMLDPIGWKILLEVLVKGNYSTIHEIPYTFVSRDAGTSKMCAAEQWNYLRHIARLVRSSQQDARFLLFCAIGSLGVFVNLGILKLLIGLVGMDELSASFTASGLAMVHNFILNSLFTWKDRVTTIGNQFKKFPLYVLVSGLGILITGMIARAFLSLDWNIYAGQLTGILVATYWSYVVNDRWTWSAKTAAEPVKLIVTQEYSLREGNQ